MFARPRDKCSRGISDLLGHFRFRRDELRGEPRKESNQIVRHQNLPIASFPRTDPNGWNCDRL